MKSVCAFGLSLGVALLCGTQAFSQTNQQLLQDGLISAMVFALLEQKGAKTPEQRYAVIQEACSARKLPPIDCGASRRRTYY